ncbi:MAG: ABC transporter ATP-binding protein [Planctomycetota bacterium]|jgi:ATP-binding cassette subfamily B protein
MTEVAAPSHPLLRLWRYARRDRRRIVLATAWSIINKALDLAPPVLIGTAIDVVTRREDSVLAHLGITSVDAQLLVLAGLTLVIWAGESLFEYLLGLAWRGLAQSIQHEMRLDAWANVATLELRWFEDRSSGGVMSVLSEDVNQLERFLDGGANQVIQVTTTVVLVAALFLATSWPVAVAAMAPMPLVIWGSLRFQRRIAPRYTRVRERAADLNARLSAALGGIVTIKSFTAEDRETAELRRLSEDYRQANAEAIRLSSAFSPLIRMAIVIGFTATLVFGGWLVTRERLEPAAYAVLVFMTQRLLWPLTSLGQTLDLYQRAMASTARILDLVDTRPRIVGGGTPPPSPVRGEVRFEGVAFAYRHGHPVLHDVSITCPAGRTIAVVGPTGCGKTTLVKLLLRLHEHDDLGTPRAGSITLDGVDVRDLPLPALRRSIALVSQDPFLFPGTIAENIAYGLGRPADEVGEAAIAAAARAAEADGFIRSLPEGYDTVVGERGQKLSGGQRQRLSMARAILKDAPVLILDEATSAVDNETEAAIQRSLAEVSRDRTTLVIAHRLSTVRHADVIVVMQDGRVVQQGRHEDLLAGGGLYADLWRVQTGERGEKDDAGGPP